MLADGLGDALLVLLFNITVIRVPNVGIRILGRRRRDGGDGGLGKPEIPDGADMRAIERKTEGRRDSGLGKPKMPDGADMRAKERISSTLNYS